MFITEEMDDFGSFLQESSNWRTCGIQHFSSENTVFTPFPGAGCLSENGLIIKDLPAKRKSDNTNMNMRSFEFPSGG